MKRPWHPARRTAVLWAVAFLLAVPACTNDEQPVAVPVDVETCEELVDISVQLVEVWIDVLGELSIEQLLADEPPPEFLELADIANDLDERAGRLGCDADAMNTEVRAELADRDLGENEGVGIELLLDIIQGGVVADLPPPPTTTTTAASS